MTAPAPRRSSRRWVRVLVWIVVVAVTVVLLFTLVFPWVERILEQDPTLESGGGAAPAVVAAGRG